VVSAAGQLPRDPAVAPTGRVPLLEVYGSADPLGPYGTGIPAPIARAPGDPTPPLDPWHGRRLRDRHRRHVRPVAFVADPDQP
jgi:hypothetical protein